jgi:putative peptidoglycan lipid II flippase
MPRRIFGRILRIAIAAVAMGAALWWLMTQIEPWFVGTFSQQAAGLVAIIGTGMFTYAIAAIVLGVLDKATLQRLMRRQT